MSQDHADKQYKYEEPTYEYQEPSSKDEMVGRPSGGRKPVMPYEVFMAEEEIPIYRGVGVYDARQLPLAPWPRMGGQGAFIELDGQAGYFGMYAVEVPAGGVLEPERHIYEEAFFVVEGHGSTEIWREGSSKKQAFEWQPGSIFAVPLNLWHRLINATSSPALVVAWSSAPKVMELFPSYRFVFDNPFEALDRYDESEDYFKPRDKVVATEGSYGAQLRTNLVPDIVRCYVPLNNRRAPGQGYIGLHEMAGNTFINNSVFEYPSGRYSTAHCHLAGRVLLCLKGKGYSINWHVKWGKRPWEVGKGHLVNHQDYIPGGMVSAAPGSGDWFHQHFSIGRDSMRVMRLGTNDRSLIPGLEELAEEIELPDGTRYLSSGRYEIRYPEEDPQVKKDYKEALKREGVQFTMPEAMYRAGG